MSLQVKRKDPLTRQELFDVLSSRVCVCTYSPQIGPTRTARITLIPDVLAELDNRPIAFESIREAAMFDAHSINALNVDTNEWVTIEVNSIKMLQIP